MAFSRKPAKFHISARDVLIPLQQLSREPFQEVLALCLAARPTPERMVEFAQDYPDRWANIITIMARLAGYSEKIEATHNHLHVIGQLSDGQLQEMLDKIRHQPDSAGAAALDGVLSSMAEERGSLLLPPPDPSDSPIVDATSKPAKKRRPTSNLDKAHRPLKIRR